jgi:NADP-dependent 3-hydroxy acid dehydrogenase YdfG
MEDSFADKVVLVTGATSGIGHAVAVKFAEASARVVALGRNQDALREVEAAVKDAGGEALTLTVIFPPAQSKTLRSRPGTR